MARYKGIQFLKTVQQTEVFNNVSLKRDPRNSDIDYSAIK